MPAGAGHELSFYPSFYPQEISVETHPPGMAAALFEKNLLHAYVGADPFAGADVPAHVKTVESLGTYQVLTLDPAEAAWRDPASRCAAARALVPTLAGGRPGLVFHPYPVTPYHADYLQHADLAAAAKGRYAAATPAVAAGPTPRVEVIEVAELVAGQATSLNGWLGPPWLKEGWFHAYLLQAPRLADPAARQEADALYARLTGGSYANPVERMNLERALVTRLGAGCERVVMGYTVRREPYSAEFSEGIQNVAADTQAGLDSAIFIRTAKLKDFPWNGWLKLGVPARAAAAWNPVGAFRHPVGRLVWLALGDPAFFPAPGSASWIGNRATVARLTAPEGGVPVPRDALLPEPGTGIWRPVGEGVTARSRIEYRVLASTFHDETRMTVADTLYPLSFAYRWGAAGSAREHDPLVETASARLRDWLAGLRVLRVDATEREFGEVKFTSVVQTIEVYSRHTLGDPQQAASVTAPWSPVPWTVLALGEEAVRRGLGAFSAAEATRRGVPWLDLARDPRLQGGALGALVDELARSAPIPPALAPWVTPDEARERWAALRKFYQEHHHLLVTNGPYRLKSWSNDVVTLEVVRDFTAPLGVGSYDRYALPRRAYPASAAVRGDRLEVEADVDVVRKFQRDYTIAREPLRAQTDLDARDTPQCDYVVVGPDARVVAAGAAPYAGRGVFASELRGLAASGRYTVAVALIVNDHHAGPE